LYTIDNVLLSTR